MGCQVPTGLGLNMDETTPEPELTMPKEDNLPAEVAAAAPEAEVVVAPEAVAPAAVAVAEGGKKSKSARSVVPSTLGSNVFVQMQALVYGSGARNSGSVASVQHRLVELGYTQAGDEKRGYFGANTRSALIEFAKDSKIEADSFCDLDIIEKLFEGTKVEVLP